MSTPTQPAARRGWHLILACMAAGLGVVAALVLGVGPAHAHTDLVSATPKPGATVAAPPKEVRLGFSEALQAPGYLVVTAPSGAKIVQGEATVDKAEVFAPADLSEPGLYTVAYRVVSADGHPVSGDYTFTVRAPAASASSTPGNMSPGSTPNNTQSSTTSSTTSSNASASPSADATSSSPAADQPSFWSQHRVHMAWGAGFLVVAAGLVWFERRRHS